MHFLLNSRINTLICGSDPSAPFLFDGIFGEICQKLRGSAHRSSCTGFIHFLVIIFLIPRPGGDANGVQECCGYGRLRL